MQFKKRKVSKRLNLEQKLSTKVKKQIQMNVLDGRIQRPRTAELNPFHRKNLRSFRELDEIVFIKPSDNQTCPNATPFSNNSRATSAGLEPRVSKPDERCQLYLNDKHKFMMIRYSNIFIHENSLLGEDYFQHLLNSRNTTSINQQSVEHFAIPNPIVFKTPKRTKTTIIPQTDRNNRMSRREIMQKYKLPEIKIPKRITPSPSKYNLNELLLTNESWDDNFARSAEPEVADLMEDIEKKFTEKIGVSGNAVVEKFGTFFPLEFFLDFERMKIQTELVGSETIVYARCWPKAPGKYYHSLESLIESTFRPSEWLPCQLIGLNSKNYRFTVKWIQPVADLGIKNRTVSPKFLSEIVLSKDGLPSLRMDLLKAQEHREDFEYNLAFLKSINVALVLASKSLSEEERVKNLLDQEKIKIKYDCTSNLTNDLENEILTEVVAKSSIKSILLFNRNFNQFLPPPTRQPFVPYLFRNKDEYPSPGIIESRCSIIRSDLTIFLNKNIVEFRSALVLEISEIFSISTFTFFSLALNGILQDLNVEKQVQKAGNYLNVPSLAHTSVLEPNMSKKITKQGLSFNVEHKSYPSNNDKIFMDENLAKLNYNFDDFLSTMEWAINEFDLIFSKKIPTIVNKLFQQLLRGYGVELKVEQTPVPLTVKWIADHLICHEKSRIPDIYNETAEFLFEKLGNYVSLFSESLILQPSGDRIFELYRIIQDGNLTIEIECILHGDIIQYNKELSEVGIQLNEVFTKWTRPVTALLPNRVISSKHSNQSVIGSLFLEMVQDSVDKSNEFIKNLNSITLPVLKSCSDLPIYEKDYKNYLESCQDYLKGSSRLANICISRLQNHHVRGLFTIGCSRLEFQLKKRISDAKNILKESMIHTLRQKSSVLSEGMENYFLAPVPVTCKEFKVASTQHEEMKGILKRMGSEIRFIMLIKEFCNDQLWLQSDSDFKGIVDVCQLQEKFTDFMTLRGKVMVEAKDKLQLEVLNETNQFMSFWAVESNFINFPFSKEVFITSDHKYIPQVTLSNCYAKIAECLSSASELCEKIKYIEGNTTEMLEIMFLLQSRYNITKDLIDIEQGLDTWRRTPFKKLEHASITAKCDMLAASIRATSFEDMPLLESLYNDLITFRKIELPFSKRLANSALSAKKNNWEEVEKILEMPLDLDKNSINDIRKTHTTKARYDVLSQKLQPIEEKAEKEFSLSKTINDMWDRYNNMPIDLETDDRFGITLVKSLSNYISMIDSDILTVGVLISSPGVEQHLLRLNDLNSKLKIAAAAMRYWESMQPLMINVHSFFESEEVRSQLLLEMRTFKVKRSNDRCLRPALVC